MVGIIVNSRWETCVYSYKCKVFLVIFHSISMTLSQASSGLRGCHMPVGALKIIEAQINKCMPFMPIDFLET